VGLMEVKSCIWKVVLIDYYFLMYLIKRV
jgi:hypothetical protein